MIQRFKQKAPELGQDVFIAPNAVLLGNVKIGEQSSIWYGVTIRGDVNSIRIGKKTNIQDGCVVHVTGTQSTTVGDSVTAGHGAIIHGCKIGNLCLVGIGAVILEGSELGEGCVVAAGSLIPPNKFFPERSFIIGTPALIKRSVTDEEYEWIRHSAEHYLDVARDHQHELSSVNSLKP